MSEAAASVQTTTELGDTTVHLYQMVRTPWGAERVVVECESDAVALADPPFDAPRERIDEDRWTSNAFAVVTDRDGRPVLAY